MAIKRTSSLQKVRFGDIQEHEYDASRTGPERMASWYSGQQFEAMRCHAYGLAKTAVLVGDDKRLIGGNSLRGLEKLTGSATSSKRRRNIVRSIVELHQMEMNGSDKDNADEIKATLRSYVNKHMEKARKAAKERALEDQMEAHKIYYENTTFPLTETNKAGSAAMLPTNATVA